MKKITIAVIISLAFMCGFNIKLYAQLHPEPNCGNNFNLNWTTSIISDDHYWPPGQLSNTYTNVDGSGTDMTITFTGETSTLGFWAGNTPKIGTQSSYLYKGIDLLSNGFSGTGITCTITFSKPVYALSFDIHHINKWEVNGDKYTFTGKDKDGNIIYPEFTNSSNPTYTADNKTGIVNAISNITSGDNSIIGVNFSDSNYIQSVSFIWEDCDTCSHYQPHATGLGNISFCTPQTFDFDGVDDYINRSAFLGGQQEVTMMSWIKPDNDLNGGEIMGQPNFRLFIDSEKRLKAFIKNDLGIDFNSPDIPTAILTEGLWHHTALIFNGNNGTIDLYLNGNVIWHYANSALIGTSITDSPDWNANYNFEIGRNAKTENNYFVGSIYECRVYNKSLSQTQLHQQINQEIENNNGAIRGSLIPKDIEGLLWSDLILYYKMGILNTGFTPDDSDSKTNGRLHNMTTYQEYTAPLPYVTTPNCSGNWTDSNNWLHGHEWDIAENIPAHAIVQVKGNLEVDKTIQTTGLIIDGNSTLKVKQNSGLFNSWYLKLDGILDLEGKSQLIQTEKSTLEKTSNGVLEKDLQGTADKFTYNYWSSPVGKINNSINNNKYNLKDIFTNINFLNIGYDGTMTPLSIADYWVWKYSNRLSDNYSSWQQVRSSGAILPGEGFTMKGPGTGSIHEDQNYTLKGKPNNGEIELTVYAGNDYFIGNPYPSALDALQFIQDNKSSIAGSGSTDGTLYFWKHWGGGSHIANEYQGGYATLSLSGGVPAASKNTESYLISTGGTPAEIPDRYIPVGQGFYATAETNGKIKFNNGQRVFQIEEDNNSNQNLKGNTPKNKSSKSNDPRMKIRLGFNSVNALRRQLLVTVDENASEEQDWGYDSKYIDSQMDDMYWMIDNEKFTIQGTNSIDEQSVLPLGIHAKNDGFNTIAIDELENVPDDLNIYLHDKELNVFHNLRKAKYQPNLAKGEYLNRFEITFSESQTLAVNKIEEFKIEVYFSNEKNSIVINNPLYEKIEFVEMFNVLGQSLFKFELNTTKDHIEYNEIKFLRATTY